MDASTLTLEHNATMARANKTWTDGSNATFLLNRWEQDILATVLFVMFVVGTIGNIMVLLAVSLSRKLQTSTNIFIVSLSVTDLLVSIVQPLQAAGMIDKGGWPLPHVICKFVAGIAITTVSCSVITLSLIAVNRYVLITQSRRTYQRIFSTESMIAMVMFSWMYPIITLVIPQTTDMHGRLGYDASTRLCIWDFTHANAKIYVILAATMSLIASNVSFTSYFLIYRHVRKSAFLTDSNATTRNLSTNRQRQKQRKVELAITRNLMYVMCCFFLCVSPYTGLFFVLPFLEGSSLNTALHISSYAAILLVVDSCFNPLIYAMKHPYFKIVFSCMVRRRWHEVPRPSRFLARLVHRRPGREHIRKTSVNSESAKHVDISI